MNLLFVEILRVFHIWDLLYAIWEVIICWLLLPPFILLGIITWDLRHFTTLWSSHGSFRLLAEHLSKSRGLIFTIWHPMTVRYNSVHIVWGKGNNFCVFIQFRSNKSEKLLGGTNCIIHHVYDVPTLVCHRPNAMTAQDCLHCWRTEAPSIGD